MVWTWATVPLLCEGRVDMPTAARRPCTVHGCPQLQPCPTHPPLAWVGTHGTHRVRGRELQRRRAQLFRRTPLCVVCLEVGVQTIATIRDHIIPLAEGGQDIDTNTQALCQTCSDTKTQRESQRGRQRWR